MKPMPNPSTLEREREVETARLIDRERADERQACARICREVAASYNAAGMPRFAQIADECNHAILGKRK